MLPLLKKMMILSKALKKKFRKIIMQSIKAINQHEKLIIFK